MFIDSHAHIDGPEFDSDRQQVIQRALDAGVTTILNVGTGDPHGGVFERAVRVSEQFPSVYTAIGVHPHDARLYDDAAEQKIQDLVASSKQIIAWGEIGLDFHYDNSPRDIQLDVLRRQLRAARNAKLPVIIHTREAEDETIEILQSEWFGSGLKGVMHCFSGSQTLAERALDLGFFISFSGMVTFKKADDLKSIARNVPMDRLMIETDCPYLTPVPFRGKRNEPAYVVEVGKCLAELKSVSAEQIGKATSGNFKQVFGV